MMRFPLISALLASLFLAAVSSGAGAGAQPSSSPRLREEARRLRLPLLLSVPGGAGKETFHLRRILHSDAASGGLLAITGHNAQAWYSGDGTTVSVFVSDLTTSANRLAPPSGKDWQPLHLADGRIAYLHTLPRTPHSAAVWIGGGHRYTAIARLPLSRLAPLARALARATSPAVADVHEP